MHLYNGLFIEKLPRLTGQNIRLCDNQNKRMQIGITATNRSLQFMY